MSVEADKFYVGLRTLTYRGIFNQVRVSLGHPQLFKMLEENVILIFKIVHSLPAYFSHSCGFLQDGGNLFLFAVNFILF